MCSEISQGLFLIQSDILTQLEKWLIQAGQTVYWKMPFTLLNLEFIKNNALLQAPLACTNNVVCHIYAAS